MDPQVRTMRLEETPLIVDYFHRSTPEHLELLGVDPTRLPPRRQWLEHYAAEFAKPVEARRSLLLVWLDGETPVGFSTADRIVFGQEAYMHLHVLEPERRASGLGAACVRASARLYFELLNLKHLHCEPHAFNVAPNRTLQKAGFKYVKTHWTVPGPLNFRQAVTRWVMER